MNATAEQIEKATAGTEKIISMGCKLPYEKIFEMELKKVQKSGWRAMSSKDIKKAASRERVETMESPKYDLAEKLRENAMNNLPSSLRK
jgi:hypothetical protein